MQGTSAFPHSRAFAFVCSPDASTGIGNSIRGNALDFADNAMGTKHEPHPEVDVGRRQTEQGIQHMSAARHGAAHEDPTPTATRTVGPEEGVAAGANVGTEAGTTGTSTGTAAPPLPPRNLEDRQDGVYSGSESRLAEQTR